MLVILVGEGDRAAEGYQTARIPVGLQHHVASARTTAELNTSDQPGELNQIFGSGFSGNRTPTRVNWFRMVDEIVF